MGRGERLQIELKQRDRQQIEQLLGGGLRAVRTTLRALALRQMDQGQSTPAVGANLGLSAKAVWQIGKRYQQGGVERALLDRKSGGGGDGWSADVCSSDLDGSGPVHACRRGQSGLVCQGGLADRQAIPARRVGAGIIRSEERRGGRWVECRRVLFRSRWIRASPRLP